MPWLLLIGAITGAALYLYSQKGEAATMDNEMQNDASANAPDSIDALIERVAVKRKVDPDMLRAICFAESNFQPDAVRWNPPHDVSVGIAQILCVPPKSATEGADYVCTNRFNITPWPVSFEQLKDPALCVDLAAQILALNIRDYGFKRGVAMYNDFAARHAAPDGPFPNDAYVRRVFKKYNTLKGIAA